MNRMNHVCVRSSKTRLAATSAGVADRAVVCKVISFVVDKRIAHADCVWSFTQPFCACAIHNGGLCACCQTNCVNLNDGAKLLSSASCTATCSVSGSLFVFSRESRLLTLINV